MALEDIVKSAKTLKKNNETLQMYRQAPGAPEVMERLYGDMSKLEDPERQVLLQQSPAEIEAQIARNIGRAQEEVVSGVEENYRAAFNSLDAKSLYEITLGSPAVETGDEEHDEIAGVHKKFQKIERELETTGTSETYMKDLQKRNEVVAEIIQRKAASNPEIIKSLAAYRANALRQRDFASAFSKDGKTIDIEEIRKYFQASVDKYDDGAKANAYLAMGSKLKAA